MNTPSGKECHCADYGAEWEDDESAPAPCDRFNGLDGDGEICSMCGHVSQCHEENN